jgi:DHA1 family multidrug resistance protein-like MFS transporter
MDRAHRHIFAVLFFSLFTAVTGVGIVVPLLPVYALHMGAGGFLVGMIFGVFSLSRTLFLPIFGRASDRHGRKPFIVAGLLGYGLVSLMFMGAGSVETLIGIRFLQGIASAMMMPVIQAYVGDITPPGKEGFTMGIFNISMFMGLSLGPLLGGLLGDRFSLRSAFGAMGVLALVGVVACAIWLPPTRSEAGLRQPAEPVAWRRILGDGEMAALASFRLAYAACIGIIWGFLPVYADARFGLSGAGIGVLVTCGVLVSGIIQAPMGYLADRVHKGGLVLLGGIVVAGAVSAYLGAQGFGGLLLASGLFGMGGGVAMPALMGLAVRKGQEVRAMGSVMALLTVAHSVGMLAGALLAGLMMDTLGLRMAFPMGSGLMVLALGMFCLGMARGRRGKTSLQQGHGPPAERLSSPALPRRPEPPLQD